MLDCLSAAKFASYCWPQKEWQRPSTVSWLLSGLFSSQKSVSRAPSLFLSDTCSVTHTIHPVCGEWAKGSESPSALWPALLLLRVERDHSLLHEHTKLSMLRNHQARDGAWDKGMDKGGNLWTVSPQEEDEQKLKAADLPTACHYMPLVKTCEIPKKPSPEAKNKVNGYGRRLDGMAWWVRLGTWH